jgi:hypothetical protein
MDKNINEYYAEDIRYVYMYIFKVMRLMEINVWMPCLDGAISPLPMGIEEREERSER